MTLPAELTAHATPQFWARLQQLKPALVQFGYILLARQADGAFEPRMSADIIGEIFQTITDSDDNGKWVVATHNAWSGLSHYVGTLRTWTDWVSRLSSNGSRDGVALMALRELLQHFTSFTWTVSDGGGHSAVDNWSISAGGGSSGGMSVGASAVEKTNAGSLGVLAGLVPLAPTTSTSRSGSVSINAGGNLGVTRSTVRSDGCGASGAIGAYLVPSLQVLDLLILSETATTPLSTPQVMDLLARSQVTEAEARFRVQCNGDLWEDQVRLLQARAETPAADEWIEYLLRTGAGEAQVDAALMRLGWVDPDFRAVKKAAYFRAYTPGELIEFTGDQYGRDDLATAYGLDDGLAVFQAGASGDALKAAGLNPAVSKLLWRRHWNLGGEQLAAEMVQRLAPGNVDAGISFDLNDYRNFLRYAGYPEFLVTRMQKLAYRPVGFRQIALLSQFGGANFPDLVAHWQQAGYSPTDAQLLARSSQRQGAFNSAAQGHGFTVAEVVKLLLERGMDDATADAWLRRLFLTDDEIAAIHQRVAAELHAAQRKERLAAIHTAYVHGGRNRLDTLTDLGAVLVVGADANYLIDTWDLQKTQRLHTLSRTDAASLLKDGLITGQQYLNRLAALGYSEQDAADSLGILLAGLRAQQSKAIAAQTKAAQAKQAKQLTALNRANSAAARAAAHLSRLRAQKVNAEEHAAFVTEQAARIQQVRDEIATLPPGIERKKAENALARAIKTDSASEVEAERLRLLAAEGGSGGAVGGG